MGVLIEFEGLGENVISGLKETIGLTNDFRAAVKSTNEEIKKGAQENLGAQQKLGQTIEATAQAMGDLNKQSTQQANQAAATEKSVGGIGNAFKRVATNIKEFAIGARDGLRQAVSDFGGARGMFQQFAQGIGLSAKKAKEGVDLTGLSIDQLKSRIELLTQKKNALISPQAIAKTNRDIDAVRAKVQALDKSVAPGGGRVAGFFRGIGTSMQGLNQSFGQFAGQVPVIGQFLAALGPVGVAVGALAGGLLAVARNTDAGRIAIDGLQRASGLAFASITGAVVSFSDKISSVFGEGGIPTLFGRVELSAKGLIRVLGPLGGALSVIFEDALDAGQRLAEQLDDIGDRSSASSVQIAKNQFAITKSLRASRDVAKSEEDRIALAQFAIDKEKENLAIKLDLLTREAKLKADVFAEETARNGKATDTTRDELRQAQAAIIDANTESVAVTERAQNLISSIRAEGAAKRLAISDKEKAQQEKDLQELAKLEEELARRSQAGNVALADDPQAALNEQRKQEEAKVQVLEDSLKKANLALGEAATLTEEQEQQLAIVRLAIQVQYDKDRTALEIAAAEGRLALITDTGEKERAQFEIELKKSLEALKAQGVSYDDLIRFAESKRAEFNAAQLQSAIDTEEAIALAKIDAIKQGAESEEQFRFRIETMKLQVQENFAKQRLQAIKDDTSEEAILVRAQLEAVLGEIDRKRAELQKSAPKFSLIKALGLNLSGEDEQKLTASLQQIGAAIQQAVLANIQAQEQNVQSQIESTDQIIDDQRRRRDDLQSLLDQALEDQRNGYANNADALRAQIEDTTKAEQTALTEKKRLFAEQKKLAKQRVLIESLQQSSSLITAGATLFADGATKGPVGIIVAIATIAGMIASFLAIRAKIKASQSDVPQFRKGGVLEGPSHEQGGIALFDRRSGQHFAEAEGGEHVTNRERSLKYHDLLKAVNEGTMPQVQRAAMAELQKMGALSMDQTKVREIVHSKERVNSITVIDRGQTDKALIREVRELREAVGSFKAQERDKPTTGTQNGRPTVSTPTRTVIRR